MSAFKPEISIYGQNKAKWNIFSKTLEKFDNYHFYHKSDFTWRVKTSFVVGYFDDFSFCLLIIENIHILKKGILHPRDGDSTQQLICIKCRNSDIRL